MHSGMQTTLKHYLMIIKKFPWFTSNSNAISTDTYLSYKVCAQLKQGNGWTFLWKYILISGSIYT